MSHRPKVGPIRDREDPQGLISGWRMARQLPPGTDFRVHSFNLQLTDDLIRKCFPRDKWPEQLREAEERPR